MGAICCHPGCKKNIKSANKSKVCASHLHGSHCKCRTCMDLKHRSIRTKPTHRADTRVIQVDEIGPQGTSRKRNYISLKKEPWL